MPCSSASSSGSCGIAYPTFPGCKSLSFSRVSLCIPVHICFIACLFPHCTVAFAGYQFLWVLQTWWETWVPTGLFSLALVWTLSLAGLMPRQLVPCWFRNDWRGLVALIPGILQLSGYNIACCCGLPLCALVRFRMFQTFASFFFYLDWHMTDWQLYNTHVAFAHSTVFHWWVGVSLLLVCSPLHYHVLFYGTSLHSFNVGNRAKLSIQVIVILDFFFFFFFFFFF